MTCRPDGAILLSLSVVSAQSRLLHRSISRGDMTDYLLIALLPAVTAVLVQWLTQHSPLSPRIWTYTGIAAPFFVAIAILFALFANFLVNDVWVRATERKVALEQSLEREIGALQSMRKLSTGLGSSGDAVKAAVDDYLSVSLGEAVAIERGRDAAIDNKLQQIVSAVLALQPESSGTKVAQTVMLQSFGELELARAERKPISVRGTDPSKWFTVIALGVLTQVAIAFAHLDKKKAQAAALFLFTLSFVLVLIVIRFSERKIATLGMQ